MVAPHDGFPTFVTGSFQLIAEILLVVFFICNVKKVREKLTMLRLNQEPP